VNDSSFRPEGFPRLHSDERNNKDLSQYELVACVTAKLKAKKKDCEFSSGNVLELHEGEFEVRLMEAHTAKLVETKSFKGSSPGACPVIHSFFEQREKEMLKVEPAFEKYLAKLQGPKP
jgi:hypothetical protein